MIFFRNFLTYGGKCFYLSLQFKSMAFTLLYFFLKNITLINYIFQFKEGTHGT